MSYHPRPFVRSLVLLISGLLLLLLVIHLAAVYLLRYQLEQVLDPQPGRGSYVGDLELNIFTGTAVIHDIQLGPEDAPYLLLSDLALDVQMSALFEGRLVIDRIDAGRGFWKIERRPDGSIKTGLPKFGQRESSAKDSGGGVSLPLLLRHAELDRFNIIYSDPSALPRPQTLRIDRIAIDDVSWPPRHPLRFAADLRWNQASVTTRGQASIADSPTVEADLRVRALPLAPLLRLSRQPQQLHGVLATRLKIALTERRLKVDGSIQLQDVGYADPAGQVGLQTFAAPDVHVEVLLDQPDAVRISGEQLALQALSLSQADKRLSLAELRTQGDWAVDLGKRDFSLHGLALSLSGLDLVDQNGNRLAIKRVRLTLNAEQAGLTDPQLQGDMQLDGLTLNGDKLALGQLQLAQSQFSRQRIALGEMVLAGLNTRITRTAAGQWQLPVLLGRTAPTTPAAAEAKPVAADQPKDAAAAPRISLAGVRLQGDNRIHLQDLSIKPPLKLNLRIARLKLGEMNSARPNADTPLDLLLQPDDYTALQLKGELRPFSPALYINIDGALSDLELAMVNGLIADSIGNRFVSGHINDRFKLKIASNRLTMNNALHLQNVDVESVDGKDALPLSTAVALLENRDGAINLDLPISGDLNNPDFHVMSALNPVILKAVAGTAALALQPVGSVLLVGSLLADQVLKVRFEPVLFDPGTAQPATGQTAQVVELAGKLRAKPKLRLRVCGVAAVADRPQHKVPDKAKDKQESDQEKAAKAAALNTQLLKLAEQRAAWVRKLMLDKGVAADQLRRCRPKIDTRKTGKPRVEIRL